MATQKIAGRGMYLPGPPFVGVSPTFGTTLILDASGEKAAFVGRFFHKDGASKNIAKVGFRFGAVTKGATTDIQVSLQDVNATDAFPDETADQSVTVGNANITANTWREVTLGAARATVAPGTLLAVVFEYATFNAADSVVINSVLSFTNTSDYLQSYCALKAGAGPTWALVTGMIPNVVLGCDDGTYGGLEAGQCCAALNANTFNSGSTPDEYALIFQVPFPCTVDGGWVIVDADGDFDMVLYDGTSAMSNGTVSQDKDNRSATGTRYHFFTFPGQISLAANHDYYLSLKPTSATNLTNYTYDVNTAAYMQALDGGTPMQYTTRTDAGSWAAATTTRRPWCGLRLMGLDDGVSAGGGLKLAGVGGLAG